MAKAIKQTTIAIGLAGTTNRALIKSVVESERVKERAENKEEKKARERDK